MPIYDYVCSTCSTRTEFIHGIDAPAPRFCPACGAEDTLRKAFVPPAVHFKGSGWAKKDRAGGSATKTKAAAAGEGKGGEGKGDGKTDASGDSKAGSATSAGSGSESGSSGGSGGSAGTASSAGEG